MDRTREAAWLAICQANERGAYTNLALKAVQNDSFSRQDRAFATSLVYGTVSMQLALNHVIAQFSSIPLRKIAPKVLAALQLGLYQILWMDRVPDSAACNTAVDIAKRHVPKSAGFVNAILRNAVRNRQNIRWPDETADPAVRLSIIHSYPEWLVREWLSEFGPEFTEGLLAAGNGSPPLTVRVNRLRATRVAVETALAEAGAGVSAGMLAEESLNVHQIPDLTSLPSFRAGWFSVQDESAMLVAAATGVSGGERVLDLCSAPGGKTTHLAERMGNAGSILACDIHEGKLHLVEEAAQRLGITIIRTMVHDATTPLPESEGMFDCVLVDAPCSGTGIIRRKPDIKWHRSASDAAALVEIQKKILYNAERVVRPGGVLVYSTCAVGRAENDCVADAFAGGLGSDAGLWKSEAIPAQPGFSPELAAEAATGRVHLYPNRDGADGFFIARFRKNR